MAKTKNSGKFYKGWFGQM